MSDNQISTAEMQRIENEIEKNGFSIVENILDQQTCENIKLALEIAIEDDQKEFSGLPGKNDMLIVSMINRGDAFVNLLDNNKMHQVFSHFLDDTCVLYSYTSTYLRSGEKPPAANIHVDTPRLIPNYHQGLIMTIALDDFNTHNGSTWYLPHSHKSEQQPSSEEFFSNGVRVCRPQGAAVFFNPRVWHCAGENHSNETRYGITLYACRSYLKQRFDYPRMVERVPTIKAIMTQRIRRFLGYNVRIPTHPNEYYVTPEQRLYLSDQG